MPVNDAVLGVIIRFVILMFFSDSDTPKTAEIDQYLFEKNSLGNLRVGIIHRFIHKIEEPVSTSSRCPKSKTLRIANPLS